MSFGQTLLLYPEEGTYFTERNPFQSKLIGASQDFDSPKVTHLDAQAFYLLRNNLRANGFVIQQELLLALHLVRQNPPNNEVLPVFAPLELDLNEPILVALLNEGFKLRCTAKNLG